MQSSHSLGGAAKNPGKEPLDVISAAMEVRAKADRITILPAGGMFAQPRPDARLRQGFDSSSQHDAVWNAPVIPTRNCSRPARTDRQIGRHSAPESLCLMFKAPSRSLNHTGMSNFTVCLASRDGDLARGAARPLRDRPRRPQQPIFCSYAKHSQNDGASPWTEANKSKARHMWHIPRALSEHRLFRLQMRQNPLLQQNRASPIRHTW